MTQQNKRDQRIDPKHYANRTNMTMPDTIRVDRDEIIGAYQLNRADATQQRVQIYKDGHTDTVDLNQSEMSSEIDRIPPRRFIATDNTDLDVSDSKRLILWDGEIELADQITLESGNEGETRTVRVEVIDENE